MSNPMKKLSTAKRVLSTRGVKGLVGVLSDKKADFYTRIRKQQESNWLIGKLVEMRGNLAIIDGCEFSVDSPTIPTSSKSWFLFDYEAAEREALNHILDPSLPVVEFGGSVGVIACLTNKKLSDPRRHIVVEANPDLIPLLQENRGRNGCQFTVIHGAVAYGADQVTFHQHKNFLYSSTQPTEDKSVTVPTVSLKKSR